MRRAVVLIAMAMGLCAGSCDDGTRQQGGDGGAGAGGSGNDAGSGGSAGSGGTGGTGGTTSQGGSGGTTGQGGTGAAGSGGSGGSGGTGVGPSCASPAPLALPSSLSYPMGPEGLCFSLDLAANEGIDLKIPTGGTSGSMTLRAPGGDVVWTRSYRLGGLDRILLEVVDAGTYRLEIGNDSGKPSTVTVDAAQVDAEPLAVPGSAMFTVTVAKQKLFVVYPARPDDLFAVQYDLPKPGGTAGLFLHPLQAKVQLGAAGVRALAYRANAHYHPIIEAYRSTGDDTELVTLSTVVPQPFVFGADNTVTAPPAGQLVVLAFDGVKDTLYTSGGQIDPHAKDALVAKVYAPSGAGAEVPAGVTQHVLVMKETGPYTVEMGNSAFAPGGSSVTFRLDPVPAPTPIVAADSPQLTGALALGEVKRYGLDVVAGRIMRLVLSSPTSLEATALIEGGKAWEPQAVLSAGASPHVAPGGAFIVQKTEPAVLSVYSGSIYLGQATGDFTLDVQDPEPEHASLGAEIAGTAPAYGMRLYHVDVQAGPHLLRWSYQGDTLGNDTPLVNFLAFAPSAPFQDYGGDLGTAGAFQGKQNETIGVLREGTNTLVVESSLAAAAPFSATLVALGYSADIAPGDAARGGTLAPYARAYFKFAGTAARPFTLRVSAAFAGKVYVHPLDAGDPTYRSTAVQPFPANLAATEQALSFTTSLTQDHVIEIDGTDAASGTYSVKLESP